MKIESENDAIAWKRHPATLSFIEAAAKDAFPKNPGKQKEFKKLLFDGITANFVDKSGTKYDYERSEQPDYIKIKRGLLDLAKLVKKSLETGKRSWSSEGVYRAARALKRLSFIDAIMPLADFTKWVVFLQTEFDIKPEKLKRQLSLSDEEIAAATYVAKPAHHELADGKGRAWHNRILGTKDSRDRYVPFLRYWLYYIARKVEKKSPTEAGDELIKLGFPSVKRESDDTLIKRYEGYFLE